MATSSETEADADFIANAKQDIPYLLDRVAALTADNARLVAEKESLEEVLADKRRLTRELDVAINGESGAAKQASLIDVIGQVKLILASSTRAAGECQQCKELAAQIDAFWFALYHSWDIEPREYFEAEIAKGIGFSDSPMAMAVHHMWKREVKDAPARAAGIREAAAGVRACKYQGRGNGLEDSDPHSDNHPDYERAMIDEALEGAACNVLALLTPPPQTEKKCN